MKKIKIYSIGHRWGEEINHPGKNVIQHVIDMKICADPWGTGGFQEGQDGRHPDVKKWMARNNAEAIEKIVDLMLFNITAFLADNEFDKMKIYFRCKAGFQRSVFMAENLFSIIEKKINNKEISNDVSLRIKHINLDLARTAFAGEFKKQTV